MVPYNVALFARLEAKPGKEEVLGDLLRSAQSLAAVALSVA